MLKPCPECKCLSVEYDPQLGVTRCLNIDCNWVLRAEKEEESSFEWPKVKLSETLEKIHLHKSPA